MAKKWQRAALTTKETRYNFRLKERDKKAYRNQLQLLTKQNPSRIHPLAKKQPKDKLTQLINVKSFLGWM